MQTVIAGDLFQMKVRSTKIVIGKINAKVCLILKQNPITQELSQCYFWSLAIVTK